MKKLLSLAISMLLLSALLVGCAAGSLPPEIDPAEAEAKAKTLVEAASMRDYDLLVSLYTDIENYGITPPTAEEWAVALDPLLNMYGEFVEFGDVGYATYEDDIFGAFGVILLETKYEDATVTWQISFSLDMEYIGLRV